MIMAKRASTWAVTVCLAGSKSSSAWDAPDASPTAKAPALAWKEASGKWESALELTNITDKWYLMSKGDAFANAGSVDGQPGRPREWALTVKRKF